MNSGKQGSFEVCTIVLVKDNIFFFILRDKTIEQTV